MCEIGRKLFKIIEFLLLLKQTDINTVKSMLVIDLSSYIIKLSQSMTILIKLGNPSS